MAGYKKLGAWLAGAVLLSANLVLAQTADTVGDPLLVVRYPSYKYKDYLNSEIQNYRQELLFLALKNSGKKFSAREVEVTILTSSRNMRNLLQGVYDVNWMHTSVEREQQLIPIRIPIHKGLIGWRIAFIRENMREVFMAVETVDELRKFKVGQGYDWPDIPILKSNNFSLVEASGPETLINMLNGKRLDIFPRSVIEIWEEQEVYSKRGVIIDQHIAIQYPTAFYIFVERKRPDLAAIIEEGLEIAIADGSFDKLFNTYFLDKIERAELNKRKIFRLKNSALPQLTPLSRTELWFDIQEGSKNQVPFSGQ